MHYKKPKSRNELLLYPNIDLWVGQDNPVRLIDLVIEKFVIENPTKCSWGGHSDQGCTSYSPSTMLKLLMYCYFNWIPGSRRMENETYRNIEVIWLLGELKPDHWTICKFRRENKGLIRLVAIEFRKFLMTSGYIEGKTIVFDGSKMKAYAGRDVYSEKKLKSRIGNIDQIKEIQAASDTTCYIPIQEPPTKKQDRENNLEFIYNADNDNFTCSNNKPLKLYSRNFKQDDQTYNIYKCHDCTACPIKDKCTKSKTGRAIKVNVNHAWIDNYREWIGKKGNIEKVKQRKTIVEHPFGTIKMMMGKFCFLLRKKHKVQIEVDLYSTAYNLKRLINIENMDFLLQKVRKYNWKIA